jgi:hypothetical protein
MSAERLAEKPEAADEHPAITFAREVRASVVMPTKLYEADYGPATNVQKTWERFGWAANENSRRTA